MKIPASGTRNPDGGYPPSGLRFPGHAFQFWSLKLFSVHVYAILNHYNAVQMAPAGDFLQGMDGEIEKEKMLGMKKGVL